MYVNNKQINELLIKGSKTETNVGLNISIISVMRLCKANFYKC